MEEFDLDALKRKVLRRYPAFGSILSSVKYRVVDKSSNLKTAGTNGKEIIMNKDYMNTLTEDEQIFVLAHEICHIAFEHKERRQGKDVKLWNIATDAIINKNLEQDGLAIPEHAINMEEALNYDAEELYNILLEQQNSKQSSSSSNNGKGGQSNKNNSNQNSNAGHDDHSMWGDTPENNQEDEQDNTEQEEISESKIFKYNRKQVDKKAKDIMDQLQKSNNGNSEPKLENIGNVGSAKNPTVNWKKILRKELEMDSEKWGYRFSDKGNGYAPRLEDFEYEETAQTDIMLDTSGSVSIDLLKAFLRQIKAILPHSKIRIATFASKFNEDWQVIKSEKDIDNLQLNIGGGTNFNAASEAFTKNPRVNKICFTDGRDNGDALIMNKRRDIIWISFDNPHFKPDHGKVIFVNPCELNKFMRTSKNNEEEKELTF